MCYLLLIIFSSLHCRDTILEFKGAYFLPSDQTFKTIFSNGGAIYGPEITAEIYKHLYGFVSADFFSKNGKSIGFCTPTKASIINLSFGLKYLASFCYGDFYVGLGVLPTRLKTNDCSPFVINTQSQWGCGGIVKVGAYIDLPKSFVLDLFIDYSFVNIKFNCCPNALTQPNIANLNGCWFGAALGYRFN